MQNEIERNVNALRNGDVSQLEELAESAGYEENFNILGTRVFMWSELGDIDHDSKHFDNWHYHMMRFIDYLNYCSEILHPYVGPLKKMLRKLPNLEDALFLVKRKIFIRRSFEERLEQIEQKLNKGKVSLVDYNYFVMGELKELRIRGSTLDVDIISSETLRKLDPRKIIQDKYTTHFTKLKKNQEDIYLVDCYTINKTGEVVLLNGKFNEDHGWYSLDEFSRKALNMICYRENYPPISRTRLFFGPNVEWALSKAFIASYITGMFYRADRVAENTSHAGLAVGLTLTAAVLFGMYKLLDYKIGRGFFKNLHVGENAIKNLVKEQYHE